MTTFRCEVHGREHTDPRPLEVEQHHPVCRAWQLAWLPPTPPYPGEYADQTLWDDRVIFCPPTCHRNVHKWIVVLMHQIDADLKRGGIDEQRVSRSMGMVAVQHKLRRGSYGYEELVIAALSPARWLEAGGDLRLLTRLHLWGQS